MKTPFIHARPLLRAVRPRQPGEPPPTKAALLGACLAFAGAGFVIAFGVGLAILKSLG